MLPHGGGRTLKAPFIDVVPLYAQLLVTPHHLAGERDQMRRAWIDLVQREIRLGHEDLVRRKSACNAGNEVGGARDVLRLQRTRRCGIAILHCADGNKVPRFPPAELALRSVKGVVAHFHDVRAKTRNALRIGLRHLELPHVKAVIRPFREERVAHEARVDVYEDVNAAVPQCAYRLLHPLLDFGAVQLKRAAGGIREHVHVQTVSAEVEYALRHVASAFLQLAVGDRREKHLRHNPRGKPTKRLPVVLAVEPLQRTFCRRKRSACGADIGGNQKRRNEHDGFHGHTDYLIIPQAKSGLKSHSTQFQAAFPLILALNYFCVNDVFGGADPSPARPVRRRRGWRRGATFDSAYERADRTAEEHDDQRDYYYDLPESWTHDKPFH